MKVRASGDGREETLLYYDAAAQATGVRLPRTAAASAGRSSNGRRWTLQPGEPLQLRVFVDKSVVEVYANDRQAIGRRVYPAQADSLGVVLFTDGGEATFKNLNAWEMAPANPF